MLIHLHSSHWREGDPAGCLTVCGKLCDATTAYRSVDPERTTCPICTAELARVGNSGNLYVVKG